MIATGLWEPSDRDAADQAPVIGWRTWVVDGDRLTAISRRSVWEPGENRAECFARGCSDVPGRHCHCGFWALNSPVAAMYMAMGRRFAPPGVPVPQPAVAVGLIHGYGAIALHGAQGFRAEYASIVCLFADAPQPCQPSTDPLSAIAERYGVPHPTLQAALSIGLLQEFGVETHAIQELRSWLLNGRPLPNFEPPPRPSPPPLKAA